MKGYIILLLILFLLIGCKKNDDAQPVEEKVYSTKLDSKYKLLDIYTSKPVDINRDGVFSADLKTEVEDFIKKKDIFFLELSTTQYRTPMPYQAIDQWLPLCNVIKDNKGNFIEVAYGLRNLLCRYYYDEKTNKIQIIPVGAAEISSAELIDTNKLKIVSRMNYYTSNGWELLTMIATYEKNK